MGPLMLRIESVVPGATGFLHESPCMLRGSPAQPMDWNAHIPATNAAQMQTGPSMRMAPPCREVTAAAPAVTRKAMLGSMQKSSVTANHPAVEQPRVHGDPCTVVLFGATGDLTRKKLIGAIYDLLRKGLLADNFHILAVDREPMSDEAYRDIMRTSVQNSDEVKGYDEGLYAKLAAKTRYVGGDLTAGAVYAAMRDALAEMEGGKPLNRLFYLAVPPVIFEPIVKLLADSGVAERTRDERSRPWRRLVIEKPFGTSLPTARTLNQLLLSLFGEHQVYRID